MRNPSISATEIDAETFLVEPDSGEVFYLDEIASALWRLLEAPRGRDEIVETFVEAFPDVGAAQISGDIDRALGDLAARGLVLLRP
jgi:hypothetical protein